MSRMSISMCEKDGVPSVITIWRAAAASATRSLSSKRPGGVDAVEQVLGAGLLERHPPFADGAEASRVVVDPDHPQTPVRERQRQGKPTRPRPTTATSALLCGELIQATG